MLANGIPVHTAPRLAMAEGFYAKMDKTLGVLGSRFFAKLLRRKPQTAAYNSGNSMQRLCV